MLRYAYSKIRVDSKNHSLCSTHSIQYNIPITPFTKNNKPTVHFVDTNNSKKPFGVCTTECRAVTSMCLSRSFTVYKILRQNEFELSGFFTLFYIPNILFHFIFLFSYPNLYPNTFHERISQHRQFHNIAFVFTENATFTLARFCTHRFCFLFVLIHDDCCQLLAKNSLNYCFSA